MGIKTLIGSMSGKKWGHTKCVYEGSYSEVHVIRANKGGYCSKHLHKQKWNRFVVLGGKLKIILYKDKGEDVTILTEGMFSDVPPGIEHRFEALEDTLCLEIYWIDGLDPNDIERVDSGGRKNVVLDNIEEAKVRSLVKKIGDFPL